jgi:hypothetical protein
MQYCLLSTDNRCSLECNLACTLPVPGLLLEPRRDFESTSGI